VNPDSNSSEPDNKTLAATLQAVDRLIRAARRNRNWNILLSVVSAVVVVTCIVTGAVVGAIGNANNNLRQSGITQCDNGNSFRSEQTEIWKGFVQLLVQPGQPSSRQTEAAQDFVQVLSPDPKVQQEGAGKLLVLLNEGTTDPATLDKARNFIKFVEQVDATRNCQQIFSGTKS
jgi:hypothetical protein